MSKKRKWLAWMILATLLIETVFPWGLQVKASVNLSAWNHVSQAEKDANLAAYEVNTGVMSFGGDDQWKARMINTEVDLSGKDWSFEFDANLAGGALLVSPNYEDETHFAGVSLDFGANVMDGVVYNDTYVDSFSYETGYTDTWVRPTSPLSATAKTKIEFRNGPTGTLSGGTVTVYQKAAGASVYTNLGTYTFGANVADTSAENRPYIQLRMGSGSISNIQIKEIKETWKHVSEAEKTANLAAYDETTGTMAFGGDAQWYARMINTELDLSGKDWAIEFDANLAGGALMISPNFEDETHFAGVSLDFGANVMDGVVYNGTYVDQFSYETGYQDTWVRPTSPLSPTVKTKVEFHNGATGTLAGGTVTVYQMAAGATEYTNLGTYTYGDNVADTAAENRLYIQLRMGSGSISNIQITELKKEIEVPTDKIWAYVSEAEEQAFLAAYDEGTGVMSFGGDDQWKARLYYTELDLTGKDWTVEFDANLAGGALMISPNFEDETHFAGVSLDFGANVVDGVVYNNTYIDRFSYETGYADTWVRPTSQLSVTASTKIEFRNGAAGTLAGGSATVYQKAAGANEYTQIAIYTFGDNIADTTAANRLYMQLRLGSGSISNIRISELTKEPEIPVEKTWTHVSDVEAALGTMYYNEDTGVMTFPVPDGSWGARMLHTKWDLDGKNWALEFDVDLQGGELIVCPVYEDAVHFAGVGIDFGANILDGIIYDGDMVDDLSYVTEFKDRYVSIKSPTKKGRLRIEFRNGEDGTMSGGAAIVYQKAEDSNEFVELGAYVFDERVVDTDLPNQMMIHLRLGAGTISDISLTEISDEVYVPEKPAKWVHLNVAEEELGYLTYNEAKDTMTFKDCIGWAGRMINTEIEDISGQNFAVEFDANLNKEGIIGVAPFYESIDTFYAVGYDILAYRLDGVGIMGTTSGELNVIDEFAYINDDIYPAFGIQQAPSEFAKNVRIRAEFFLGPNGTMAGGTAVYCYKEKGSNTWQLLGRFLMPDTIIDNPDLANKIMIYGHVINGSIKNIDVIQNIKTSVVEYKTNNSTKWGYVSKLEEVSGNAYYSDEQEMMTILYEGGWNARMISLTVDDVTGKAFAMEFDTDFGTGGAIGIVPFFENEDNWYGVYLDRGAGRLDGVGYKDGKIMDDFCYVNDTLYDSFTTLDLPATGKFKMRFEYFPNADGGAAGAICKIFYRTMIGDQDRAWRLAGEFKIPEEVNDHKNVANRIVIHGRLLEGTLSDITYSEIDPNTQTVYFQTDESLESGYPDDSYEETAAILKITEFGSMPWYSIVLMVAGVLTGAGLLALVIVSKKRKNQKIDKL